MAQPLPHAGQGWASPVPGPAPAAAPGASVGGFGPSGSGVDLTDDVVASMALEVVRILSEYENAISPDASSGAAEAAALLTEIRSAAQVRVASGPEEKARRMDDVVEARHAYRRLLDGDIRPAVEFTSTDLVEAELLHRAFVDAEAKARKSMSGPGAFKKFAAARKALNAHLVGFGVETYEELISMSQQAEVASGPATLQEAADAVARAEAAWLAVDDAPAPAAGGLASTAEMDALRVRAYRCLGAVVDDSELIGRLEELAASGVDSAPILRRLGLALRAIGIQNVSDPVTTARTVRHDLRRSSQHNSLI